MLLCIAFYLCPEYPGPKRDIAQWSAGGPSVTSEDSHAQVIAELESRRDRDPAALVVVDSDGDWLSSRRNHITPPSHDRTDRIRCYCLRLRTDQSDCARGRLGGAEDDQSGGMARLDQRLAWRTIPPNHRSAHTPRGQHDTLARCI